MVKCSEKGRQIDDEIRIRQNINQRTEPRPADNSNEGSRNRGAIHFQGTKVRQRLRQTRVQENDETHKERRRPLYKKHRPPRPQLRRNHRPVEENHAR